MTTADRISKSWAIRRQLVQGILDQGEQLINAMMLVPETGEGLTFERWKRIVEQQLDVARRNYGNGEPLLSEQEIITLASILNPRRGW